MNIILNSANNEPRRVQATYSSQRLNRNTYEIKDSVDGSQRLNRNTYEIKDLVDGSIDKEIIVNVDDKETINEEAEETKKILNEEREAKREMYIRHSRMLYPEKENWIIEMAVDAYILQEEKGVDIMTHKFKPSQSGSFVETKDLECEVH